MEVTYGVKDGGIKYGVDAFAPTTSYLFGLHVAFLNDVGSEAAVYGLESNSGLKLIELDLIVGLLWSPSWISVDKIEYGTFL